MSMIDFGPTYIDDFGKVVTSHQAQRLSNPPNINIPPDYSGGQGARNLPSPEAAPTPQSLGQTPQTGSMVWPNMQKQGDPSQLPRTSIPSEIYKAGVSEMPDRKNMQPHGIHKVLDILAGLSMGSPAGIGVYRHLQDQPYNRATQDWSTRLAAIKPEVQSEEFEKREAGETSRSEKQLEASKAATEATERHRLAQEAETDRQRQETERRDLATEDLRKQQEAQQKRRDDLTEQFRQQSEKLAAERASQTAKNEDARIKLEERRLGLEAQRLNKENKNQGTWQVMRDKDGNAYLWNDKTLETKAAPSQGIEKPAEYEKEQAKEKPFIDAQSYAEDYIKSGKFTGAGDYALVQALNAAVQSDRNRFQRYEFDKIVTARSVIEGMIARGEHLTGGTYLSPKERQEFLETIQRAVKAKTRQGTTPQVNAPNTPSDVKINSRRPAN